MASVHTEGPCIVCDKSNARFCDRCKSSRYCSKACQRADWPTHKLLCPTFLSFNATKRPSKDHFRAIFFPVSKEKPKLIWLHCPWHSDEDGSRFQFPNTDSFLGTDAFPAITPIQYNLVLQRKLSDTIRVRYRDTFLVDGSRPNKSVAPILDTQSYPTHDWRGPVITYGMEGLGIDQVSCRDLDMNDFRHIADFLISYGRDPATFTPRPADEKVKGVRINCLGDQKMCNRPKFEAVELSSTHSIFSTDHDVSDIAKRIELPIFTQSCPPDPKWAKDEENKLFNRESPFNNQDATFLHLCCDPKAEFNLRTGMMGWAWASMKWQNDVGSAIVVRQDKKPLLPLHAEALCRYCRGDARSFLAYSIGEYAPEKPMEKDTVLAMICRPAFVVSWYNLLEEKRRKGEDASAPYPYYDVDR